MDGLFVVEGAFEQAEVERSRKNKNSTQILEHIQLSLHNVLEFSSGAVILIIY